MARLWQKRAARQEWFRTQAGARVRVLYPGRPGISAGPDFRNAILEMEGVGRVQGDVEIHVRQQDWDAHGHTGDPRYNGVVLHVALDEPAAPTGLESGRNTPVVSMAPLLTPEDSGAVGPHPGLWQLLAERGYQRPDTEGELVRLLDYAGDVRFLDKSRQYARFLEEQPAAQTLYEGLLEGLGYQHNQHPFSLLAHRAPYQALADAALRLPSGSRVAAVEAWLAHLSGLRPGNCVSDAPGIPKGLGPRMDPDSWNCFRVRPANHPLRRIAGAAGLIDRSLETGLVEALRREAESGTPKTLTAALSVVGQGKASAAIGQARARDLAINVVLPLLHALAEGEEDSGRSEDCLELYSRFGKGQENELTQEMTARLLEPDWKGLVSTARRQQGLLHLHHVLTVPG